MAFSWRASRKTRWGVEVPEEEYLLVELATPIGGYKSVAAKQRELVALGFESALDRSAMFAALRGDRASIVQRRVLAGCDKTELTTPELIEAGFAFGSARHPVAPGLTVDEHIRLSGKRRSAKGGSARGPGMVALLRRFGISPADRCGDLSGGQQQAVMLAITLSRGAEVVIIEEPWLGVARTARDILERYLIATRDWKVMVWLVQQASDPEATPSGRQKGVSPSTIG